MADWHLAPSLQQGRTEVNKRWPNRDRTSDGTIGDESHQERVSDHNPNDRGSVNAWDVDVNGVDIRLILDAFERHPSAHYWIYNRQIADRHNDWRPIQYGGTNPHTQHAHLSIHQTYVAEIDPRPWGIYPPEGTKMSEVEVNNIKGHIDAQVLRLAQFLTHGGNRFFNADITGNEWMAKAVTLPVLYKAMGAQLEALSKLDPVAFANALAASPEALAALTVAMKEQIPLAPTPLEVAQAFLAIITGNVPPTDPS